MPPRRTYDVQPDSLAFSRSRREHIRPPRRPDDESTNPTAYIPDHVRGRIAYEKRQEKKSMAADIEADLLANNDEPAYEDLLDWIPPTLTGDDALDDCNYSEERVNYLIKFIAHRDGYDLRPDVEAGKYTIDELEEFYEGGLDSEEMDITPEFQGKSKKGKGKDKEETLTSNPNVDLNKSTNVNPNTSGGSNTKASAEPKAKDKLKTGASHSATKSQAQTVYSGITIDDTDNIVTAKRTGKAGSNSYGRPPHHLDGLRLMSNLHATASPTNTTPVKRTDDTTFIEGVSIPRFSKSQPTGLQLQSRTPVPNRTASFSNALTKPALTKLSARAVGTRDLPTNRSTNSGAAAEQDMTNQHSLPSPAQSQASPTSNHLPPAHHSRTTQPSSHVSKSSRVKPNEQQMPTTANASITSHGDRHIVNRSHVVANARSVQNVPRKPTPVSAVQRPSTTGNTRPHPYPQTRRKARPQALDHAHPRHMDIPSDDDHGQPQPEAEQGNILDGDPEEEQGLASDSEMEPEPDGAGLDGAGLDMLALVNETKSRNKAPIGGFDSKVQPLVKHMSKLAKARIIANGIYDDTEVGLAMIDREWPRQWDPRVSREEILIECWELTCAKYRAQLPFVHKLSICVDSLLAAFCTGVKKGLKPLIDAHFGFHPKNPRENKNLSEKLLDHGFHDKDYRTKKNPFESKYLQDACKAVAFGGGSSSIGAKYNDIFDNTPPPFIAFVCAISHHVILCYCDGHYAENDNLNISIQTPAFRLYLQLLIEMHENQPQTLSNIRGRIHDHCWSSISKVPVQAKTSQPPRKWGRDTDEVYVRKFKLTNELEVEDEVEDHESEGEDGGENKSKGRGMGAMYPASVRRSNNQYDGGAAESSRAGNSDAMMLDG